MHTSEVLIEACREINGNKPAQLLGKWERGILWTLIQGITCISKILKTF